MTDIKDQTHYPENPPWTMFFDGPLYEKYKEFMANKDFSQILLTTKLKMANQSNTAPSVSEFGGGMGWWIPGQEGLDKPVNQFAGDEYNTVSDDFYRKFTRGKKDEKRRTRRTRAILLLIILVLLIVSLGTALIIHYFFIPTDQDEAPAQVNISFSGNTSIFDMTTVTSEDADKADTRSSIHEILEAIQADTHRPEPDTVGDEVTPEDRLLKDVTPRSTSTSNDSGATTSQSTSTNTTSTTHRVTTEFIDPMDFFGMDEHFTITQAVQTTTEGTADATTNETTLPSTSTVSTPESSTGPEKGSVFSSVTTDTTTVGKVTETELQGQEGKPLVTMASTVAVPSETSTTTLSTTASETTTGNDSFPTTIYEPTTHVSRTGKAATTGNVLGTSVVTTTTVSETTTKPMPSTSTYPTTTTESFTTPDLTDTSNTDVPMFETTTEDMFTEQTTFIEEATTTDTNVIQSTMTTLGQTAVPPVQDAISATPTESTTTTLIESTTTLESSSSTSAASSAVPTSPSSTSITSSAVSSASTNAPSIASPPSQTVTPTTLNTDTSVSGSTTSDGFSSNTTSAETSLRTEPSTVTITTTGSESPTTATTSFTSTTTSALNTSSPSNAPITTTSTTIVPGTTTSTTIAPITTTSTTIAPITTTSTTIAPVTTTSTTIAPGTTTSTTIAPITTTSTTIAAVTTTSPIMTNTTVSLETTEPSTASATTVSSNTTSTDASFTTEHDTTIAETTQTTTTPTPETTTEVLPQMTMEGSTTYTSEAAEIKCRVTNLGRFESLSISEVKHFAVVKVTLYSNGTVKWSYSKTRRHDVQFEFTNITGNYLRELKLSMLISNVQCKDAGSFVCDLKTRAHEVTNSAKLVVVGRPDNKIKLKIGPSIVEDRAVRLTAIWQGGYPIPWTNMSWTAYDTNNNSYNLADYGDYRDYKLREDHLRCETFLESSIVIFPKIHLNDTTVIVKPSLETTRSFLDHTMKEYLTTVEYGVQKILVIPLNYCQNGSKEVSIPHPYTECSKFIWCLPGDLVVQQCPGGTCFDEGWEECI